VVADPVPLGGDPPRKLGMAPHLLAHEEEGRPGAVAAQELKDRRGALGVRAVVDREPHFAPRRREAGHRRAERLGARKDELHEYPGVRGEEGEQRRGRVVRKGERDRAGLERDGDRYPGSHAAPGGIRGEFADQTLVSITERIARRGGKQTGNCLSHAPACL
jgi:hypothetical protein